MRLCDQPRPRTFGRREEGHKNEASFVFFLARARKIGSERRPSAAAPGSCGRAQRGSGRYSLEVGGAGRIEARQAAKQAPANGKRLHQRNEARRPGKNAPSVAILAGRKQAGMAGGEPEEDPRIRGTGQRGEARAGRAQKEARTRPQPRINARGEPRFFSSPSIIGREKPARRVRSTI